MGADPAQAATLGWQGELVVSPFYQEVKLGTDQETVHYSITIKNTSTAAQLLRLSLQDFGALDETGGVAFLGMPAHEMDHPRGLASWMKLDRDSVVAPGGGAVTVGVTVRNSASLTPGGHYGAVVATAVSEGDSAAGAPRVGLKEVVSSLVLLAKAGGVGPALTLTGQTAEAGWWQLPRTVMQRFRNSGDVHTAPRGVAELRDLSGRLVARGVLNESSGMVLPGTYRQYRTPLVQLASAWMPGPYRLTTTYRPDGVEATMTLTTTVWYAGAWWVWLAAMGLLGLVGAVVWWWRSRSWPFWRRRR